MARLNPDTLDPAEMYLSPAEVAELLAQLPADHPLVAAARVGVELADNRHATAVDHADTTAAVRAAVREQGGTPVSGRDRAVERREATAAWQRMAEQQGPGSYAALMVDALTRTQVEEPAEEPERGYTRSEATETCLRWAREYREQRAVADESRQRFADSPVDYGDDHSDTHVDDEHADDGDQLPIDEPGRDWAAEIAAAGDDVDALRSMWWEAPLDVRERIAERGQELTAADPDVAYPPCDHADDTDDDLDDGYGGTWWVADEDDGDDAAVA